LFWAGDVFAPKLLVKGRDGIEVSIQQYLQEAFLDMYDTLVRTVGHLDGVIGFEVCFLGWRRASLTLTAHLQALNEPHTGFINLPSMHSYNYNTDLHLGFVREHNLPSFLARPSQFAISFGLAIFHARFRHPY
jgi:hypothetical protein